MCVIRNRNGRQNPANDYEDEEIHDIVLDWYSLQSSQSEVVSTLVPDENRSYVGTVGRDGLRTVVGTEHGAITYLAHPRPEGRLL